MQTPTTSQPTPSAATPELPARNITDDFKWRVPLLNYAKPEHMDNYYRLISAEYVPDGARRFGPDHHILVEVLDAQGKRKMGVPVHFYWDDDEAVVNTNKQGGPYAADYGMTSAGHGFGVWVGGVQELSDNVFGMGLGKIGSEHMGDHVTYHLVFQEATKGLDDKPVTKPIETQLPYVPNDGPQPAPAMPELTHPVSDAQYRQVTQRFGVNGDYYKRFAVDGVPLKGHNGIDYATPIGAWIVAVDSGRVVEVADDPTGYGKYVKIAHSWGESLYAHLADQLVRVGESINRGELLGNSGNTGNSTGPHLHFGLRVAPFDRRDGWGGFTDPAPYLPHGTPRPLPQVTPASLVTLIKAAAQEFGVEWQLLASLAWAESSWNPNATSAAGAMGMCQIMGPTWREWSAKIGAGPDAYDARQNLRVGAAYLAWLGQQVKGDTYRALHAFVFGIGNVTKGVPIPEEAYDYADRVVHGRDLLKAVGA